jgi:hypothetical protein
VGVKLNWVFLVFGVLLLLTGLFWSGSLVAAGLVVAGAGFALVGAVRDDGQAR